MLELKDIVKNYYVGEETVEALKGVSVNFRKSEFVAILGPSGCGKTTLLNIIGGLDRYTSGDLVINGVSTKLYKDKDWDTYRNHSVGFVFQSYNLIPHLSVLENVELALTLSGVSKKERRERAKEMLIKVGLGDKLSNRPNQLSGGQCQRVSIARALINDPEIILADEPTGALDSVTSVQIMELLQEIAREKLVIMVTHNPELAEQYATRIVRFIDGKLISDTDPFDAKHVEAEEKPSLLSNLFKKQEGSTQKTEKKRASMSFFTALSLSLKNLLTKKARTFLVSMAGSIGIIGIALILSISTGVQMYIDRVQEDTLSSYPLSIERETVDVSAMISGLMGTAAEDVDHDLDQVYSNDIMMSLFQAMTSEVYSNNLVDFKKYIEDENSGFADYVTAVQYSYSLTMNIYSSDTENGVLRVNPSDVFGGTLGSITSSYGAFSLNAWTELIDNDELIHSQYDLIAGSWPDRKSDDFYRQVILVVDENNEISDYVLYSLGLADATDISKMLSAISKGEEYVHPEYSYTYDELLNTTYKLVLTTDCYAKQNGLWTDMRKNEAYMKQVVEDSVELQIVGIVRPNSEVAATSIMGAIGYSADLTEYYIERIAQSEIVKDQMNNPEKDVLTGKYFNKSSYAVTMQDVYDYVSTLTAEEQDQFYNIIEKCLSQEDILEMFRPAITSSATYSGNLKKFNYVDPESPNYIYIYAKDFESKDKIEDLITAYNTQMEAEGKTENKITYTDYVGLMMSSVSIIIDVISYVLIAFVSVSLVVSSIMIGIITYISVLERIKEIGILRAVGASKRDISNVFNAEALIIGFTAGSLGILVTLLLTVPANLIIGSLTGIYTLVQLPAVAGVVLVLISMSLTFVAGLFPSAIAAKKDPVEALRSE